MNEYLDHVDRSDDVDKPIWKCRRSILAIYGITCLTYLGLKTSHDVSLAIAGIVTAIAGANSFEKAKAAIKGASDGNK